MQRILVFLVALGIGSAGVYFWNNGQNATNLPGAALAQDTTDADIDTSIVQEMALGDPEAPVTVIEYASATCPHCKNFHQNTFKEFKTNYIDTGKVHFIYREVYFDRFGLWAGMVARCGGPERFFGIMDMVFEQQSVWARGDSAADIAENLRVIGRTAGLTTEELDACLQDEAKAQAMIAVYQQNAEADGVRSTPTFLINGELVAGDQSYSAFAALVDAAMDG